MIRERDDKRRRAGGWKESLKEMWDDGSEGGRRETWAKEGGYLLEARNGSQLTANK